MRRGLRQYNLRWGVVLFLLLMTWNIEVYPAQGYAPIDNLIFQVDQLLQFGQIYDAEMVTNLIASLQVIGSTIDAGDTLIAKQLLSAFTQEVSAISSMMMTATAADQLISGATTIASGL